jgi:glycine cleavage system H protein
VDRRAGALSALDTIRRAAGVGTMRRRSGGEERAMEFPEELRYSTEHEWVRVEGSEAVVGITDFAQDSLGDVVYVSLPELGTSVAVATSVCEVESTKSVSDIYAPVSGRVIAVNESLADQPELVNADPYGGGWMFRLTLTTPGEIDQLLDAAAYRTLVES